MSGASSPGTPPPPVPRPGGRTALKVLLIVVGVILILPGICSLGAIVIVSGINPTGVLNDGGLVSLWAVCFLVAGAGILLIRHAVRRNPTGDRP
jgi:hypothetical protein